MSKVELLSFLETTRRPQHITSVLRTLYTIQVDISEGFVKAEIPLAKQNVAKRIDGMRYGFDHLTSTTPLSHEILDRNSC